MRLPNHFEFMSDPDTEVEGSIEDLGDGRARVTMTVVTEQATFKTLPSGADSPTPQEVMRRGITRP